MFVFVTRIVLILALVIGIVMVASCSDPNVTDVTLPEDLIARMINNSSVGKAIYPPTMFDTSGLSSIYPDTGGVDGDINPLTYWVEVMSHSRRFIVSDSCAPNEFNQDDPCARVLLENGGLVPAKIAQIFDTAVCRYHIVNRHDHKVTIKQATIADRSYALVAQFGSQTQAYGGWTLHSVGRQRTGTGFGGDFPALDSVVLIVGLERYLYEPGKRMVYLHTSSLPLLAAGESFTIAAYTKDRGAGNITDAWLHYVDDGEFVKEQMSSIGTGDFRVTLRERSGARSYGQFVVELFLGFSLRDGDNLTIRNLLWGVTYRL